MGRISRIEHERRLAAFNATTNDREAAFILGIPLVAFRQWRQLERMPARGDTILTPGEHRRRQAAYTHHGTDTAAAESLGMTREAFKQWRERYDLPARTQIRLDLYEHGIRLKAYDRSNTDREAAEMLGITEQAFYKWRVKHNLPPHTETRWSSQPIGGREHERRMAAYHAHTTDLEAAEALGLTEQGFAAWRRSEGLPARNRRGRTLDPDERDLRLQAYHAHTTDADAAQSLGMKHGSYRTWRRREGLPAKAAHAPPGHQRPTS